MEIEIPNAQVVLHGDLEIPSSPRGLVIFVHGSGSSRLSPRNKKVAEYLNQERFATLLFDLLSVEEEKNRQNVFDITKLSERLVEVTNWVSSQVEVKEIPIGYFGASTGAAAALIAATLSKVHISAVVSRGGRVDLANRYLAEVRAPTLMIVGEEDQEVLVLNRTAQAHMTCLNEILIIPGATHLFEEPGALDLVTNLAAKWFMKYLI